jgi:hypothetical protein
MVFCLNETVAVPLFAHLRAATTALPARATLDRILLDEVRHRDFGWACLDWFLTTPLAPMIPRLVEADLPTLFAQLDANYSGADHDDGGADHDDGGITPDDRKWGLAPLRDYAAILDVTFERDYRPRFAARGIDPTPAWAARRG